MSTLLLILCSAKPACPQLLVAAAADLSNLEKPLSGLLERTAGEKLRFTLGSSGLLAQQIGNGAPYDVFLSANELYVRELAKKGAILPDSVAIYATGRIALWSKGNTVRFEDLKDPRIKHLAIPNPAHAPYGVAARQALERQGLWNAVQPKVVFGENVRQTLQFAETGNADACITAWSLVIGTGGVPLPSSWHDPIRQAAGISARSTKPALARRFLELLRSPDGRKLLERFGFSVP